MRSEKKGGSLLAVFYSGRWPFESFCPQFCRNTARPVVRPRISKYFKKCRRRTSRCVFLWVAKFSSSTISWFAAVALSLSHESDVVQIIFHVSKQPLEKHINTSGARSKLTSPPSLWIKLVHLFFHSQSGCVLQSIKLQNPTRGHVNIEPLQLSPRVVTHTPLLLHVYQRLISWTSREVEGNRPSTSIPLYQLIVRINTALFPLSLPYSRATLAL